MQLSLFLLILMDNVILVKQEKNWEEAIDYCRENYVDLVSVPNQFTQMWVQEKAKKANTSRVWLGMRYTCVFEFWFWVTDMPVCYKNWGPNKTEDCNMSGAMGRQQPHQWISLSDETKLNFICANYEVNFTIC
ncbi:hypothetical protein LDENG_00196120 [Lucifuga dentata]|nr:hypothetical protein LDENG_00196120 [Lucifuga dentata]